MVDYPIIRFVAALGETTARLDLNDADPFITDHDDFSFGAPTFEGQPLSTGAPYGYREVTMTSTLEGDSDVSSPGASALAIEVLRPVNWILYQQDAASDPLWIRTYASQPGALNFEEVTVGDPASQWRMTLTLQADPWLRAEEVTVATQTITNDPADSNGVAVELPTIQGDAPTPLSLEITSAADMAFLTWYVSTAAVAQECTYAFETPIVLNTAHFSLFSGAPLGSLTTAASALGDQMRRTNNLPFSWTPLLENPTGSDIPVGNYKVLARLRQQAATGDAGVIAFSLGGRYTSLIGTEHQWQTETRHFPNNEFLWYDLGSLYLPVGARPDDATLTGSRKFGVRARSVSGDQPQVDFGGFMLVPIASDADNAAVIDSRVLKANIGRALVTAGNTIRFDGDAQRVERSPGNLPLPNSMDAGVYPQGRPGYDNFLFLSSELGELGSLSGGEIDREFSVTVKYRPRLLHPLRRS